jgi:ABC-type multidrug transport system fused ATPase/permease subunit
VTASYDRPSDGSSPLAPDAEPISAWNLRARWKAWWDLKGTFNEDGLPEAEKLTSTLRRMWTLVRGETKLIFGASLFMTLAALAELLIPHYVSASIFAIANKLPEATFHSNVKLLAVFSLSYGFFAGLRGFLFSLLATRLMEQLRGQVFDALIRQPVEFFDKEEVGALTSRLGSDCQAIVRCLATNLNVAVRNSLQCIGGAAYLLYMSRTLAGSCAAVTSLLWLVALRYGAFQRKSQRLFQDALADTGQVAEEVFTLSRVVRTFGTEKREGARYSSWLKRLTHLSVRQAAAYLMYLTTNSGLFYLTKVATLLVGGSMAMKGQITAQQLTSFVMYVEFVTSASLSVCDQWGPAMEALGASERVISYLDAPEAPQIASGAPLPQFSGQVEFRDVSFRYPTRQEVLSLNEVSLTLRPGRLVALVGLSGSGKSTLVALLQRLYDSSTGKILVDGKDLTEVDAGQYRRQIGVVAQDPHLLSMSIADNIAYGLEEDGLTLDDIEAAAKMANAHDFIMAFPRGYRTMVTDKLLSGGQRQRIALARALVRDPRLLILDEATSALDAQSEAQVQAALDRAMKATSRSCLVIAHRLVTVRNADEILVMDKGQIVEQGDHDSLVARGGIYAKLVARQSGGGLASSVSSEEEEDKPAAASQDQADAEAAALSVSVSGSLGGSVAESPEAGNIVPATPKREREAARSMESIEGLSLDEEPAADEMWAGAGEATHDVPDHAGTRTP